ncbi:MAG: GNAT family N-acetyltransferase [Flavobacteriales bacterium]|nr:GNAT family N-acetyltransferase [Flavobacteriales bacterium]
MKSSDAQMFYELNQPEEVFKFTGDLPFESISAAENFIDSYDHYQKHGFGRWVIEDQNRSYGWCGIKRNEENDIDLGFRILKKYWGQGIASECAIACLDWVKENHPEFEVIGRCHPDNIGSIKVLEKCGMKVFKRDSKVSHGCALYFK